ncbi:putative spermidine/putrescine transport system permease protein [Thermosyntropha lipolytica DSM 11003]|uniref:Putative spermidine/putrescine transport system permease protein n=1 Tax=Thermosyntropha lipolytica DSM 11003 TaxID=1123382 RepID=A0A1M5LXY9_9FIRM|nr:ABC transporter permease subunit [Thermosyntropha lipolytica]SHG69509.1 putative spermidine/putrescine transport system permease protein [Thermosyntropha lipolytica DSM 11003]
MAVKQKLLYSLLPFIILVALFQIAPLFSIIKDSFSSASSGGFTTAHYEELWQNPFYMQAFKNSFLISIASSLAALLAGIIIVKSILGFSPNTQEKLLVITNMVSNFAGVPLAFAFIILLGTNGLFTLLLGQLGFDLASRFDLYSWRGLILIYVYFQLPLAVLLLLPAMANVKKEWREAAFTLGANPLLFTLKIELPFLLPSLLGTLSLLLANAMGAYATAYALAGSNFNLITIRIAQLIAGDLFLNPHLAGAMTVILGLMLIASMFIYQKSLSYARRNVHNV